MVEVETKEKKLEAKTVKDSLSLNASSDKQKVVADTSKDAFREKVVDKSERRSNSGRGRRTKNVRKRSRRRERPRSEFEHQVIDIRRVARVMAGGRRFSFSVTVVAGDRKGRVGVGVGKAGDTATAIDKSLRDAKKNIKKLNLTDTMSIAHKIQAKYSSAVIQIFPAPGKGGITAGGAVRNVLELAGVREVGAKIISRSKNKLNNARAAICALEQLPKSETQNTKTKDESARKKI